MDIRSQFVWYKLCPVSQQKATINFSTIIANTLSNDIDSALFGTWVDNVTGTTLTATFASDGIYNYSINSDGEFELSTAAMPGYVFATLIDE